MEFKPQELKADLITKRCIENSLTMDEAAAEIGISKATLSRLEKLKLPDVETLGKVCTWLGTFPNKYYGQPRRRMTVADLEQAAAAAEKAKR